MSIVPTVDFSKESVLLIERELIFGLKSGEESIFNKFYNMYASTLLGVLKQIVNQQETAEDLLQECFIKISGNIESYDPDKSRLFTWIINIARNCAIDHLRKRSSHNQKNTIGLESMGDEIGNHFSHSFNTDTIGMKNIISALSPKQRLVIEMIYFHGYTHTEVADELNMPIGSVKTSLRYAVLHLRKIFSIKQKFAA